MMQRDQHDPAKNPGLDGFAIQHWLAYQQGRAVGRLTSFINPAHLGRHQDAAGHFGFLATDPQCPGAIPALMAAGEEWLRGQGMRQIAGPFEYSVNDECGLLIDGFDTPAMMMMPHGRPDYAPALEAVGYAKAMDLFAYLGDSHEGFPRRGPVSRLQRMAGDKANLTLRPLKKNAFRDEIGLAMDIFNDSWSDNWGFVPFSDAQVQQMAADLKLLLDPDGFWFGEIDGQALGFVLLAPNLNEAIRDLDGRLLPFGWAKLLWRLKATGLSSGRVPLTGIRRSVQKTLPGAALMVSMFDKAVLAMRDKGIHQVELSWILESNRDVQKLIRQTGAEVYKTYRIYQKPL